MEVMKPEEYLLEVIPADCFRERASVRYIIEELPTQYGLLYDVSNSHPLPISLLKYRIFLERVIFDDMMVVKPQSGLYLLLEQHHGVLVVLGIIQLEDFQRVSVALWVLSELYLRTDSCS